LEEVAVVADRPRVARLGVEREARVPVVGPEDADDHDARPGGEAELTEGDRILIRVPAGDAEVEDAPSRARGKPGREGLLGLDEDALHERVTEDDHVGTVEPRAVGVRKAPAVRAQRPEAALRMPQ